VELLSIATDEKFRARFRGTALMRPKRRGLLRNAAIVAANIGATSAVPALVERTRSDAEPLIRSHAMWALARLDSKLARRCAEDLIKNDPDRIVLEEAEAAVGGQTYAEREVNSASLVDRSADR
jgi:epoxyqueuosine reductase